MIYILTTLNITSSPQVNPTVFPPVICRLLRRRPSWSNFLRTPPSRTRSSSRRRRSKLFHQTGRPSVDFEWCLLWCEYYLLEDRWGVCFYFLNFLKIFENRNNSLHQFNGRNSQRLFIDALRGRFGDEI